MTAISSVHCLFAFEAAGWYLLISACIDLSDKGNNYKQGCILSRELMVDLSCLLVLGVNSYLQTWYYREDTVTKAVKLILWSWFR